MEKRNNKKTEEFLGMFSLKTAPPGLKEKILDGALKKHKSNQVMSAFLWRGFVGCLLILSIVFVVDATITRAQNRRFSSFVDKQQGSTGKAEEEWSMLKDIIWEPLDSTENVVRKKFYGSREKSEKKGRLVEWRESLEKEFE
jgi:hypothetical protein